MNSERVVGSPYRGITSGLPVIQAQFGVCRNNTKTSSRGCTPLWKAGCIVSATGSKMEIAADVASNLPRKLGLIDALAIVIGMVIGGGVFLVPNLVARELKSATAILAVWVFAGRDS